MSAVSGLHKGKHTKPNPVPSTVDGLAEVMPEDWIPTGDTRVTYKGKNGDVQASTICIGAWSWGDTSTWNWKPEEEPAAQAAWRYCVSKGINFIDTAQVYGTGESEAICGRFFKGMPRSDFVIQTKFYVVPQMKDVLHPTEAPLKKLETSLKNLGLEYVDIYLVHGPIHVQSIERIAKGMAMCVDKGMAKCIGVANYDTEDMIKMQEELAKYGVPLAINQCEFSVLRRQPELSGLLKACKDRGIVYSSLAQGRLTGKYTKDHQPPKSYRFSSYDMADVEPVVEALKRIADKRGVSISAVALNYNLCKGITPVVGIRKEEQAINNCQALGWRLTNAEIQEIDAVSFEGHTTKLWQQG
jgi:aryl-alcohol dehydrogenase-like predicted oxidoreductase